MTVKKKLRSSEFIIKEDWEEFLSHFVLVHPDFIQKIRNRCPHLSNDNLKMCAYIKMGVTNKEIANKMGVKAQSLQQNQSRIKKRLGLDKDQTLRQYINTIN